MEYLLEWSNYYGVDDVVYISYWYNGMITPVRIKEIRGRKYLVDHGVANSQIKNAPAELITRKDIISASPEA